MDNDSVSVRREQAQGMVEIARAFVVRDVETHGQCLERIRAVKTAASEVDTFFEPMRSSTYDAWQEVLKAQKSVTTPMKEALDIYVEKAVTYDNEQQKIADAAAAQASAQLKSATDSAVLDVAADLEAAGRGAEAEQLMQDHAASGAVYVAPAPEVATVAGLAKIGKPKVRVVDKAKLDAYVAAHPEFSNLTEPNMPALNKMVVALGTAFNIPGCERYIETQYARTAGKK